MTLAQIIEMIRMQASVFGVDAGLAIQICRLESGFNPDAVGDNGDAVGLWQWHKGSWNYVRQRMDRPIDWPREDPWESTLTAMYAMGVLNLYHWWATFPPEGPTSRSDQDA